VAIKRVVIHDVHDDGVRPDGDHRLGNGVVDTTNPSALAAAENDYRYRHRICSSAVLAKLFSGSYFTRSCAS